MYKSLLVVKLGGSVITDKESFVPRPRLKIVGQLTKDIATIYKKKRHKIILVHGAGSFGHPIVKKYGLHKGMNSEAQKLAYSQTLQNMIELNSIVIQNLIKLGVPAVSLPPHAFTIHTKSRLTKLDSKIIEIYLKNGQVPVLFGDAVLDEEWGCSILSGDTIVSYFARRLKAKKVVFLSDVDGIFNNDPKTNPNAKLIPLINNKNLPSVLESLRANSSRSERADVTGEVYGKILSIKKDLKGIETVIANGLGLNSLTDALQNRGRLTRFYFG
ncbi:MAG: isopentenyl phosphate kinase family protein [Candidatus Blackburnbacteria bacterium]|nr:isopentenyl phosphate kinase family protein [Candidatus Blackburnbacteria bacterium]